MSPSPTSTAKYSLATRIRISRENRHRAEVSLSCADPSTLEPSHRRTKEETWSSMHGRARMTEIPKATKSCSHVERLTTPPGVEN